MPSRAPETLGRYQLISRIAVGETTEIHKARAEGVGGFRRTFALKRVRPKLARRPGLVDQLVDEARTTGRLSHANIVQIMDLGEEGGSYIVAMEYVDGPDLARVLDRCRDNGLSIPVPQAVFITLELLKALDYAHRRTVMRGNQPQPLGIIHLAIAPENLLTSMQGEVKLSDFGCAHATARALSPPPTAGLPAAYASPEVVGSGDAVDARADLFSTGVVLYEMLTGEHPFRRDSVAETRAATLRGEYIPADRLLPGLPAELARVVDTALAVSPGQRFASAAAMKASREGFLHQSGSVLRPAELADFLRRVFQDAPGSAPPVTGSIRATRSTLDADPVTHPMHEDSDARPTTIAPPVRRPPTEPRTELGDLSQSKSFGPMAGTADESTLVDRPAVMVSRTARWEDAPTRIRSAPALDTDEDLLLPDPEEPEDGGRPTQSSVAPPPMPPVPVARPRAAPTPAPRVVAPSPPLPGPGGHTGAALWLAVGAIGSVLVLGIGILLGVRLAAWAAVQRDPMVQVIAAGAVAVELDDRGIEPGVPVPVPPGAHAVRVIDAGGHSAHATVVLEPGEHRILTFQAAVAPTGDTP
ncbi:MAG: serine/threonine-protein kinase [Myxococcota bacterium]|nr:serine/threonine-protein kinase [Myxococcota bacterium]